jgi:hypothetical protein
VVTFKGVNQRLDTTVLKSFDGVELAKGQQESILRFDDVDGLDVGMMLRSIS